MAESTPHTVETIQQQQEEERGVDQQQPRLKYLDFVSVAMLQAVVCLSNLYGFAKENSGPLKPGVQSVEGTVKAVVGPVYDRFHGVPLEILKFVDRKVDEVLGELDRHVPAVVKMASTKAYTAAQKVPEVARSVAGEVQRSGVVPTVTGMASEAYVKYEPVARGLYVKYEPVVEQYSVAAWRSLNRLPLFPQVAQILVPTAAYCAEKYNKTVGSMTTRGYAGAQYLPMVPIERIAKVFGEDSEKPTAEVKAAPAAQ